MNLLDFFIIIPILFFCVRGIKNGLVGEFLGLAGLVVAVFFTFEYMDEVAEVISPFFKQSNDYIVFIAAALIFVGVLILAQLVDYFAAKFLKFVKLQTVNRILGSFFGLFKGAIIVSVILLILAGFDLPSRQSRNRSLAYSYVIYVAPWTYNAIGAKNFTQTIEKTFKKYKPSVDFPIVNE